MSFKMNQAIALCTTSLEKRKSGNSTSYVLYYGNSTDRYEGKMTGSTVKFLIDEFRESGGKYRYAVICNMKDDKPARFFDRSRSKKFFMIPKNDRQ